MQCVEDSRSAEIDDGTTYKCRGSVMELDSGGVLICYCLYPGRSASWRWN